MGRTTEERPGSRDRSLWRQAVVIVGVYATVAVAWIVLSDRLLWALGGDPERIAALSVVKGVGFVAVTAGVLHVMLRRLLGAVGRAEAERASHEASQRRAESIVSSTHDAIIVRTRGGEILSWNPAARALFGYGAEEMIGRPIGVLVPPECAGDEVVSPARGDEGSAVRELATVRLHRDGRRIPVEITVSPMPGSDDLSEIIHDVSKRLNAQAVAEREQRFTRSLVQTLPSILYLYDEEGRFLRWNDNFEDVSGYSAYEIGRMRPRDFFAGADVERLEARIAEVFARGESSLEASFVTKSGRAIPYFFTGRRTVFDGKTCLIGVGIDLSERALALEALRKSEERHRTTMERILEAGQLLDSELRYLYLNPAAAAHNRRPNHELLGRRMSEAWPGIETTPVYALLRRGVEERVALHEEVAFTFADGAVGWFDVRVQPVPEGIFVLSADITERKHAEGELREINLRLEQKVSERTRDLEAARERAEASDRVKSAFLATMSHELRTPLNSILGFTGLILQRLAGPLTDEQARQLGMVQGSARHLLDLINDILDISKIEAGALEVVHAPFDLVLALELDLDSVGPLAARKDLRLVSELGPEEVRVVSDQRRVDQIILNLLNNAIKFTERGTVTLSAVREPGPPATVRISVADTGIGIAAADLDLLFQPFRQLDVGLPRQHEGTGLGLAICRRLAGLLGGRIEVRSTPGVGSTFSVTLPVEPT